MLTLRKTRRSKIDRKAMQRLEDELDTLAAQACKKRHNWRCARCHKQHPTGGNLDAHHIVKRRVMATRWDLGNLMPLCRYTCHEHAELNPDDARDWACEWLGEEAYEALMARSRVLVRRTVEDLQALRDELKEMA